jgi:hypothetical protein
MLRRMVRKLPVVFQTDTQKEFFAATFDQLFSPANVEQAQGYIGRKSSTVNRAPADNYIGEPTKGRSAYQLEPMAYAVDSTTLNDRNEQFYEDLVNYIQFRGGDVSNHDRLFADRFYSFAPPIDIDKFTNYQNYVWLASSTDQSTIVGQTEANFDNIGLNGTWNSGTGYVDNEIIILEDGTRIIVDTQVGGLVTEFTIIVDSTSGFASGTPQAQASTSGIGESFELTTGALNETAFESGMPVVYVEAATYTGAQFDTLIETLVIGQESFNTSQDPNLLPSGFEFTSGMRVQFVGSASYDNVYAVERVGRGIRLLEPYPISWSSGTDIATRDYLTIERGSLEGSAWTRTNRWYNIAVVESVQALGQVIDALMINPGSGYSVNDELPVIGDGINAYVKVLGVDFLGAITDYEVSHHGQDYTYGAIDETGFSVTGGYSAWDTFPAAFGSYWDSAGELRTITITNGGTGYSVSDTVVIATGIPNPVIVSGGSGYLVGDVLNIAGDGAGADVEVLSVSGTGAILSLRVNNRGSNYTYSSVSSITTSGGSSANIILKHPTAEVSVVGTGGVITEISITDRGLYAGEVGPISLDLSGSGNGDATATGTFDPIVAWDQPLSSVTGTDAIFAIRLATPINTSKKGQRPIIEFKQDLQLYNYGTDYLGEVDLIAVTGTLSDIVGQVSYDIDGVPLTDGMLVIFLDPNSAPVFQLWDDSSALGGVAWDGWDTSAWDVSGTSGLISRYVWQVDMSGPTINFNKYDLRTGLTGASANPTQLGDVVLIEQGSVYAGTSFYQSLIPSGIAYTWLQCQEKTGINVAPLFQLYDYNGIELGDPLEYASSNFSGNEIFSYRILTQDDLVDTGGILTDDSVLGFPVTVTGLQQISDIVFENDLETNRYTNGSLGEIPGYYFFKRNLVNESTALITDSVFETNWLASSDVEKQRVIDRFLTSTDTEDTFILSATPYNEDLYAVVAGRRLNTNQIAYNSIDNTVTILATPTKTVVEIGNGTKITFNFSEISITDSSDLQVFVDDIFQIVNVDYTINFLSPEPSITFATAPVNGAIVEGRDQTSGAPGINTIVEIFVYTHEAIVAADRGYFEIPNELENNPNNLEITEQSWNDFTSHFVSIIENQVPFEGASFGSINNYRDTAKDGSLGSYILQNQSPLLKAMLVTSSNELDVIEALRFSSKEYTRYKNKFVKIAAQLINEGFTPFNAGDTIPVNQWMDEIIRRITVSREYTNAFKDTYMLSWSNTYEETTFTGLAQASFTLTDFIDLEDPRNAMYVYLNDTLQLVDRDYTISNLNPIQITFPANLIVSDEVVVRLFADTTPAHIPATPSKLGIYPVYKPEIVTDSSYMTPTDVIIGHDGSRVPVYGDYRDELLIEFETRIYNGIIEKFRTLDILPLALTDVKPGKFRETRWTTDEYHSLIKSPFYKWTSTNKADYRTNSYYSSVDTWTWNYNDVTDVDGEALAGYWRGIFDYYYDTQTPESTPWEMLGFREEPTWWTATPNTGDGFIGYGAGPWPASHAMWTDLEAGLIRRGDRAGTDTRYARPGLVAGYVPVDSLGALKATPLLAIDVSASLTAPSSAEAQSDWIFGDMGPVEFAWRTSESYPFAVAEALFLSRPGEFGEKYWDPEHVVTCPVKVEQIVTDVDGLYQRTGNSGLYVHGETLSGVAQVRTGYQVWISGRLRTLNKDLTSEFGELVRSLDVKLGHKMAAFTDADTMRVFVEGVSVSSSSSNLLIPTENIEVSLHTGAPVREYFYGGVLVKAIADGTFKVYGYDVLSGEFTYEPRTASNTDTNINIGGKPAAFTNYTTGQTYAIGSIVRLNGVYYRAIVAHTASSWIPANWQKLTTLPITGGLNVTHKKQGTGSLATIEYGHTFTTVQALFDFIIGYSDFLESEGWVFENINAETGKLENWLASAKEFLFWVATNWEAGSIIMLSPAAQGVVLEAQEGYPTNVEKIVNGVYSILDKNGVAIDPGNTTIKRDDRKITILPQLEQQGIYSARIYTTETENIVAFDNVTEFNDTIYDPRLGSRLARLFFNGRKTLDWIGKLEAPGYLVTDTGLVPNFENMVNSIRDYHDTESFLDNPQIEDTARHLIGFEERGYFNDLGLHDDAQFQFYKGMTRQKGTLQAIKKLERNEIVTDVGQELLVYGEWALKLGEFGPVCNSNITEFLIHANEVKGDPQLVVLSYPGQAQDPTATASVSAVNIVSSSNVWTTAPAVTFTGGGGSSATATAILDSDGYLSRIDMLNNGSGYTSTPQVLINGAVTATSDRAVATMVYDIDTDIANDDVIVIDADDNARWLIKPSNVACKVGTELWPTIALADVSTQIPNAGFVHTDDIDYMVFDVDAIDGLAAAPIPPSTNGETIWVAKSENEDWAVYALYSYAGTITQLGINDVGYVAAAGKVTMSVAPYEDVGNLTFLGNSATGVGKIYVGNTLYDYAVDVAHPNYIISKDGVPVADDTFPTVETVPTSIAYMSLLDVRFADETARDAQAAHITASSVATVWIDDNGLSFAEVQSTPAFTVTRTQSNLVDTEKFRSGFVYEYDTKDTLAQLPLYDPFKGTIPGPADLNIAYKTRRDPARYTNASDARLINTGTTFGGNQVGLAWWDLSTCAYLYYEQGDDEYRRDNWGALFTGSSIDIYEWTRSTVVPASYTGDGTVRNTTDYVEKEEWDDLLETVRTFYYFWVKGITTVPNRKDRTLASSEVARLIANPHAQNYAWFSPVSQTGFMFAGVEGVFTDSDNVFQINFSKLEMEDKRHVQWELAREGDSNYTVNTHIWDKMVDSLVGFTDLVPINNSTAGNDEYPLYNFNNALPSAADSSMGYLIVPDPTLSDSNKYGIKRRPLQSMFMDIQTARKIFVQKVNELVSPILLRDENSAWNASMTTNTLWEWVNWYEDGYDSTNTIPTRQVTAVSALDGLANPYHGEIVKVTGARYSLYAYDGPTDTYTLVGREATRLELLDIIWENNPNLPEALELRELITALQTEVFVGEREVDNNLTFFALLNYIFKEQEDLDWVFKTTYLYLKQTGQGLSQNSVYQNDPFDSAVDYITEAKPYHSKLRDYTIVRAADTDVLPGSAEEILRNMSMTLYYDRVRGGDFSIAEARIVKALGMGSATYDGYSTLDAGATLVRLGAAGRYAAQQRDLLADITDLATGLDPDLLSSYSVTAVGMAPTQTEIEAVAALNERIIQEFAADFTGITLQNTLFGSFPSLISADISAAGTGYVVGDTLYLDAGSGIPKAPAAFRVLSIGGSGEITGLKLLSGGAYVQKPTIDPVLLLGGSGTDGSVTSLVFKAGDTQPWDSLPWDQIGWDSNDNDNSITLLDGLGDAADGLNLFADIPAEEEFDGDGTTREFAIVTTTPTYFMFAVVDGVEMRLNVDYFFIAGKLVFITAPGVGTNNIQLFTYIEAGDLINPQVNEGITDEMVPLDPRESFVLVADTTDIPYAIVDGGTSFAIDDVLTAQGGTFTTPLQITVTGVNISTGAIDTFDITEPGTYSVYPANPVTIQTDAVTGLNITNVSIGGPIAIRNDLADAPLWGIRIPYSVLNCADVLTLSPGDSITVVNSFDATKDGTYTVDHTYDDGSTYRFIYVVETMGGTSVNEQITTITTAGTLANVATMNMANGSTSFRIHYDTVHNSHYIRNADSASTTTIAAIGLTDDIIAVTDVTLLYESATAPTLTTPLIAWIGNERIEAYGADEVNNLLLGVRRGTLGTTLSAHDSGVKMFAGGASQEIALPEVYWVDTTSASIYSGTDGIWQDNFDGTIIFSDGTDNLFTANMANGDTLNVTSGGAIAREYSTTIIPVGELSIITITDGAAGYSVGDAAPIPTQIPDPVITNGGINYLVGDTINFGGDGSSGAATVGTINGLGGITSLTFSNRGSGYTFTTVDSITTASGSGSEFEFYHPLAEVAAVDGSGAITAISIISRGSGSAETGTVNFDLTGSGDGTATATGIFDTEALELPSAPIYNTAGRITGANTLTWSVDQQNAGGLNASTTAQAVFINAEAGNAL